MPERGCDYCADTSNMSFGHVKQVAVSEERGTVLLRCPRCLWLYEDNQQGDPVRVSASHAEHAFGWQNEVGSGDVEPLWSDLIDGRTTAEETATRARVLMETANATHVANWGLSSLYALTFRGTGSVGDIAVAHERWQRQVRDYEADREGWDRSYYQRMITDFAERHGTDRARHLGGRLVASGELTAEDVAAVLAPE